MERSRIYIRKDNTEPTMVSKAYEKIRFYLYKSDEWYYHESRV